MVTSGITYEAYLKQGNTEGYALTTESPISVRSVPALTQLGTFTPPWTQWGSGHVVDQINGVVWFYDDTQLYGVDLGGGSDTTIPISWSSGSTPFGYADARRVELWLLAGNALVYIHSFQAGVGTQNDFYLLRREITCT